MSSLNHSRLDSNNESRVLYLKHNRSDIFQSGSTLNSTPAKTTFTKVASRQQNDFQPKYAEQSPVQRRMKEFYNVDDKSGKTNNFGRLRQEVLVVPVKQIDISETAKVRRIKDMYMSLETKNNPNNSFSLNSSYRKDTLEESFDKKIDVVRSNSKINRVESNKSNIFHNEAKTKENQSFKPQFKNNTEEKKENQVPKRQGNKTNVSTVFDWKNTNTELTFKKKQISEPSSSGAEEKYSAAKMKRRNLVSEFDDPQAKNYKPTQSQGPDQEVIQKQEIVEVIKEKFGSNQARIKKNMDTVSSLHNHETYMTHLKVKKVDRNTESFSVENVKNFDTLNENQIRSLYAKNGIHVYDVNLIGKHYDGNKTGKITFKVRKNDDNTAMDQKMNEVRESLMKEKGMEVKAKIANHGRIKTDGLPATTKWTDPRLTAKKTNSDHESSTHLSSTGSKFLSKTPANLEQSYKAQYSKKMTSSGMNEPNKPSKKEVTNVK